MNTGWIKLHNKILDWEWYNHMNTRVVFFHLLLKAGYAEDDWRGVETKPGEVVTGRRKLAKETGLSEQQVRVALTNLQKTQDVTIKATKAYSVITLNNWNCHQQTNQQKTHNRTTTKEERIKKEKKVPKKKRIVYDERFEVFWKAYAKDSGKKKAYEYWNKKDIDDELYDLILKQVTLQTQHVEKRFRKDPERYIRDEKWNDEVIIETKQPEEDTLVDYANRKLAAQREQEKTEDYFNPSLWNK